MCGISGYINKDSSKPAEESFLRQMNNALGHRGPDDSGSIVMGSVGLSHTRLSIIDLSSAGHQPISNEDRTIWITYNGEIYNYRELQYELSAKGHRFRSNTDTEVLVHLWEEEGPELVKRLRGMFAFALWDERSRSLFLARDRVGKKPLFYAEAGDSFIFASELAPLLRHPSLSGVKEDVVALNHYLTYQSVPAPFTAFKGVNKLPPAHTMLVKNGKGDPKRYWKLSYKNKITVNNPKQEKDLARETIERLRQAISIRLVSDVPLGVFLSGGLDSSLIVALMASLVDEPVKTFSIGFNNEEYNELPYARMVAQHYKTDHHEYVVDPQAQSIFTQLVWRFGEPFADPAAIPTYYLAQMTRRHVTVALCGDGGDENFGGYTRYSLPGLYNPIKSLPAMVQNVLTGSRDWRAYTGRGDGASKWFADLKRLATLTRRRNDYYLSFTHFNEPLQEKLYTPEMKERVNGEYAVDLMLEKCLDSLTDNFLDEICDLDFNLYLPDTLMPKVDITSMAHSLEVRSPMLDHEFLEFTASLPPELKLKNRTIGKYILKNAAEAYLPKDIIYRPKQGFGVPLDHWFRNELKEFAFDLLLSDRLASRGYFRREYIEELLYRHQDGENFQYLLWNLLAMELWHLMFIDKVISPPAPEKGDCL